MVVFGHQVKLSCVFSGNMGSLGYSYVVLNEIKGNNEGRREDLKNNK